MKEQKLTKRHPTKTKLVKYRIYELYRMLPIQSINKFTIDLKRNSQIEASMEEESKNKHPEDSIASIDSQYIERT